MNRIALPLASLTLLLTLFLMFPEWDENLRSHTSSDFKEIFESQEAAIVPDSTFCGVSRHQHKLTFKGGMDNLYFRKDTIARECFLYLDLKGDLYIPPASVQRLPVNLSIVIDRSGSMSGEKLRYAKEAAKFVVESLDSRDFLSIVIYDDEVSVPVHSMSVSDKKKILNEIDHIRDDGSTNLCGGMMEGYRQCKSTWRSGCVNKVMLLSDGLANVGITDVSEICKIATKEDVTNSVAISTFGIGLDFNELLMTRIAESGNGNYYFIKEAQMIPDLFDKELSGLLKVVAQNVKLEIDLPKGVSLAKSFGFNYELDGQKVVVYMRDIYSEETKAVLLKFNLDNTLNVPITFNVRAVYDDAESKSLGQVIAQSYTMLPVDTKNQYHSGVQVCIKQQQVLFEANERLEQAMIEMENGNYDAAGAYLDLNSASMRGFQSIFGSDKELSRMDSLNTDYKTKTQDFEDLPSSTQKEVQKISRNSNYGVRRKK